MTSHSMRSGVIVVVSVCGVLVLAMLLRLSLGFRSDTPTTSLSVHDSSAQHVNPPRHARPGDMAWAARRSGPEEPRGDEGESSLTQPGVLPQVAAGSKTGSGGGQVSWAGRGNADNSAASVGSADTHTKSDVRSTAPAGSAEAVAQVTGQRGTAEAKSSGSTADESARVGSSGPGEVTSGVAGMPQGAQKLPQVSGAQSGSGNPGQNPGAGASVADDSVLLFDASKQQEFRADSRLQILDAKNVVSGDAGTLSFWIQPQWEGTDETSATLVQLGNAEAKQNALEIFKDGQSLRLSLADNAGAQIETSSAIGGWQPGEQHLVTASWGQGAVAFYVDGQLVGQQPFTGHLDVPPQTPLDIGSGSSDVGGLPGVISNFRMYKRVLGANEITDQASVVPAAVQPAN